MVLSHPSSRFSEHRLRRRDGVASRASRFSEARGTEDPRGHALLLPLPRVCFPLPFPAPPCVAQGATGWRVGGVLLIPTYLPGLRDVPSRRGFRSRGCTKGPDGERWLPCLGLEDRATRALAGAVNTRLSGCYCRREVWPWEEPRRLRLDPGVWVLPTVESSCQSYLVLSVYHTRVFRNLGDRVHV